MFKPGRWLIAVLIALTGCSTASRRVQDPRALDWTASKETNVVAQAVEQVSEAPPLAPPPTNSPVPPPPPPRPHTNSYAETWIPLGRWAREQHVGSLKRTASVPAPTFALTASNGLFVVQANSRVAKWNGLELRLAFDPQLIDDQPFLHVLDLKKNLEPLLGEFNVVAKTNRVIVLDPGHGGSKTGTTNVNDGSHEKEYTLDWAKRLEVLLANNGWQVFLTRTEDVDVPLSDRVEFAAQLQADLFISLHFNSAAPSREQAGLETFCLTPTGMPSTLTREYEDDPSLVFTNNLFDADNLRYALRLHRALLHAGAMTDRGVRRARFLGVLRGQNRPAVLIEGGYLSNPREARRIADPEYRQSLAQAIADALRPEGGGQKPEGGGQRPEVRSQKPDLQAPDSEFPSSTSTTTNTPLR